MNNGFNGKTLYVCQSQAIGVINPCTHPCLCTVTLNHVYGRRHRSLPNVEVLQLVHQPKGSCPGAFGALGGMWEAAESVQTEHGGSGQLAASSQQFELFKGRMNIRHPHLVTPTCLVVPWCSRAASLAELLPPAGPREEADGAQSQEGTV